MERTRRPTSTRAVRRAAAAPGVASAATERRSRRQARRRHGRGEADQVEQDHVPVDASPPHHRRGRRNPRDDGAAGSGPEAEPVASSRSSPRTEPAATPATADPDRSRRPNRRSTFKCRGSSDASGPRAPFFGRSYRRGVLVESPRRYLLACTRISARRRRIWRPPPSPPSAPPTPRQPLPATTLALRRRPPATLSAMDRALRSDFDATAAIQTAGAPPAGSD